MNKINENLGLIHLYCGDGKGKTTASVGLAVRASGNGVKVVFSQFLKSWDTGEVFTFENIENIFVIRNTKKFPFSNKMTDVQKNDIKEIHNNLLKEVVSACENEEIGLLVMDEIISTYNLDMIDRTLVDEFLNNKPKNLEIVLTGRDPDEHFIEMADYVTEMKKIKHPFDKGIFARKAIED